MIAYLLANHLSEGSTAQELLAQYTTIPAMRDPREVLSALICLVANAVDDERTGLEIWAAARDAGFNSLSPTDRNRLIIAGLCLLLNPGR